MKHVKLFEQFVESNVNEAREISPANAMKYIQANADNKFSYSGYLGDYPTQKLFKIASGADKLPRQVYFDGSDIVLGDKTVATWKDGMTIGQVFGLYTKVVQAAAKAAQASAE